jgi:hypothetical protein
LAARPIPDGRSSSEIEAVPKTPHNRAKKRFVLGSAALAGLVALTLLAGTRFRDSDLPAEDLAPAPRHQVSPADRQDLEAALESTLENIWQRYLISRNGEPRGLEDFRAFLELEGLVGEDGQELQLPELEERLRDSLAARLSFSNLRVERHDDLRGTRLHYRLLMRDEDGREEDLSFEFEVRGTAYEGLDFALLARNINCVMCHAEVDNAARVYNRDLLRTGGFSRVRVGSLSHFQIRPREAHSRIAGTLYARGRLLDEQGRELDLSKSTLQSAEFDKDGLLVEDVWNKLVARPFTPSLVPGGNLYAAYPKQVDRQIDGRLPAHFPSVFPDVNDDRVIQDREFALVSQRAQGTLVGGRKVVVPRGDTYGLGGLPPADAQVELSGTIPGSLVLRGTRIKPLRFEGQIAVDGDVVISGFVRGEGALLVRGNIYIVDSLVYADGVDPDGARTFGLAEDGSANRLGLAAGGSIIAGDPLVNSEVYSKGLVTGDRKGALNFTMSEILLFNRMEWTPTVDELPAKDGLKVKNPLRRRGHHPRYYVLKAGDPVFILNDPRQGRVWFDSDSQTWGGLDSIGDWSWGGWSEYGASSDLQKSAIVSPLLPGDWLPAASYRGMLNEARASRHGLLIDGLLYTHNALMAAAPRKSLYEGRVRINGAIIAADLGVFAPGDGESPGFILNYDDRLDDLLDVRSERQLVIRPAGR